MRVEGYKLLPGKEAQSVEDSMMRLIVLPSGFYAGQLRFAKELRKRVNACASLCLLVGLNLLVEKLHAEQGLLRCLR